MKGMNMDSNMQKTSDTKMLLEFTDSYREQTFYRRGAFIRMDLSGIRGTDSYLDEMAREEILDRIRSYGAEGIHFFDSGNYHYMSRLFTGLIDEDFILVDFDHHTDMQIPAFGLELLSCGSWLRHALMEEPHLKKVLLIGPPAEMIRETAQDLTEEFGDRIVTIPEEEIAAAQAGEDGAMKEKLRRLFTENPLPVYFSVDKDVFSVDILRTNWDQGVLEEELFFEILRICAGHELRREEGCAETAAANEMTGKEPAGPRRIIGMDVCGEFPASAGGDADAAEQNDRMNRKLAELDLP